MSVTYLQKSQGNSASTTLASGMSNTDTSAALVSDTAFAGEGFVIIDEGEATEELAYATTKGGGALTIPLANRGLEGGSAQAHAAGASVKGVLSAAMWNNIIATLKNGFSATDGTVDGTKIMKITSTDAQLATGGNIQVNSADPYRTIVLPAGSMSPTTTAGCASVATVESTTNKVNYKVLDFDQTTEENAFIIFNMPDSWSGGTLTAKFIWTTAASSGDVIWGIKGRAFANDDAIDQACGTAVVVTDSFIAAGDIHISDATGAITVAGTTPSGGQTLYLQIYRDADAGGDTLNGDCRLVGVSIEYQTGTFSD